MDTRWTTKLMKRLHLLQNHDLFQHRPDGDKAWVSKVTRLRHRTRLLLENRT